MNVSQEAGFSVKSLTGIDTGKYAVTTASGSEYLLDLDAPNIVRLPPADEQAELRRDGERVTLLAVLECTVGAEMVILLDLGVPGVALTTRRTTVVTSLRNVTKGVRDGAGTDRI